MTLKLRDEITFRSAVHTSRAGFFVSAILLLVLGASTKTWGSFFAHKRT